MLPELAEIRPLALQVREVVTLVVQVAEHSDPEPGDREHEREQRCGSERVADRPAERVLLERRGDLLPEDDRGAR